MKKMYIALIAVLAVAVAIWFVIEKETVEAPLSLENATVVTYQNDTQEIVTVAFVGDQAVVNGAGLTDVRLTQVEAEAGAKFETKDGSVVVWSQGTAVTVYQNDVALFTGTDTTALVPPEEPVVPDLVTRLTESTWVWTGTELNDGSSRTPKEPTDFTVTFLADGTVSGTTDCNTFFGPFVLEGDRLTVGPLAQTKMACEGSQERDFMNDLSGTSTTVFMNERGELVLLLPFDSGSVIFTKEAVSNTPTILDTVWEWSTTELSDGTSVVLKAAGVFSLTFGAETVSVGTDCNNASGSYTLTDDTIEIGPNLAMTMRACEGSQESEFIQMIRQPLTIVENTGTQLTLAMASGGQIVFTAKTED